MKIKKIILVFIISLVSFSLGLSQQRKTPVEDLKELFRKINLLKEYLEKKKSNTLTEEEKKLNDETEKWVTGILDYRELGKRAMARHWNDRTSKEQDEFVELLSELVKRTSLKKLESYSEREISYIKESIEGNEGIVVSNVKLEETEISVEYRMHFVGGRWLIYDMIVDDTSLLKNYKEQFEKIITTSSYKELLDKMKKKLESLKNEEAKKENNETI